MLAGIIGDVTPPYSGYSDDATGLIVFVSNLIKLITVVGGLLLFLNLVLAGLKYIMSGSDPKAISEAGSSITNSILGLVIIAASFIIVAIISLVFFGDPTFILNPKITGPEKTTVCPERTSIHNEPQCTSCGYDWDSKNSYCTLGGK